VKRWLGVVADNGDELEWDLDISRIEFPSNQATLGKLRKDLALARQFEDDPLGRVAEGLRAEERLAVMAFDEEIGRESDGGRAATPFKEELIQKVGWLYDQLDIEAPDDIDLKITMRLVDRFCDQARAQARRYGLSGGGGGQSHGR
jgi:hypothetical protein